MDPVVIFGFFGLFCLGLFFGGTIDWATELNWTELNTAKKLSLQDL